MKIQKVGTRLVPQKRSKFAHLFYHNIKRGGKPLPINAEQVEEEIIAYFSTLIDSDGNLTGVPSLSGLALALGLSSHRDLPEYLDNDECKYLIERAVTVIEHYHEVSLTTKNSPVGSIFALKNLGWKNDAATINVAAEGPVTIKTQLAWDD